MTNVRPGPPSLVEPQGQNRILLIPGANHALQPAWLASHDDVFRNAELMLVQLELPNEVVEQALHLAKSMKFRSCWILPQSVHYPKRGRVW